MNNTNPSSRIPNRWLECPRKANKLIVDKFMAFKTPLNSTYNDQVPMQYRFTPKMLFDSCQKAKINFGLWIDLTNTSRFYDKSEIEKYDCKYIKMPCRGYGETPDKEATTKFINLVKSFIAQNPLKHIAVHCTHGFNRTGFLIVSYLIIEMDCSVNVALDLFAEARPTGIYKQSYVDELFSRYADDDDDDNPLIVQLPNWCSVSCGSNDEENDEAGHTNQIPPTNPNNSSSIEFMKGVNGVRYLNDEKKALQLQKIIQKISGYKHKDFPGCQPVSMDMDNILLLNTKRYMVSWKADGTRYMMFINGENEVYFFDRKNTVFHVNGLKFVQRHNLRKHVAGTLLDGEMVIDKVNGQEIPRYLVYDILSFENNDIGKKPFPARLNCLESELINPRYMAICNGLIDKTKEPFSVRKKEFWPITTASSLLGEKFAKSLSHEPDGLIFQPTDDPYIAGRCDLVLKWKPLDLNSVDFRLTIVKEAANGKIPETKAYLFVLGRKDPFAAIKFKSQLKQYNNKIIECKFEDNQWMFMRERTDKTLPNSYQTAIAVCESIRNPVTKEHLLHYIENYRFKDDMEIMPPPPRKVRKM